ncbi:hypothetical protein R5R35_010368 [Gryllus longicercus]|uniref:Uncharacterized protein n=1 Tax=Gryllus longicercus TaxID=2509291 RepID=A0AAN9VZG9_9ORTH
MGGSGERGGECGGEGAGEGEGEGECASEGAGGLSRGLRRMSSPRRPSAVPARAAVPVLVSVPSAARRRPQPRSAPLRGQAQRRSPVSPGTRFSYCTRCTAAAAWPLAVRRRSQEHQRHVSDGRGLLGSKNCHLFTSTTAERRTLDEHSSSLCCRW